MQAEQTVELEHTASRARRIERERAAQTPILRLAVRRDGREPVERAPQDHDHEARVGVRQRVCDARERRE